MIASVLQVSSTAQAGTGTSSNVSATSPASRPASFISVEESSGAELSEERNHESEDDGEFVRECWGFRKIFIDRSSNKVA